MSRTYRKTSRKHGKPLFWGSRHMAQFDHNKAKKVEPYGIKSGLYEKVTETYETDYKTHCPYEKRIYVPQGTPKAYEQLGTVITWGRYPEPTRREPSKWFLIPPNEIKTRTYKKYLGINPEYVWSDQRKVWEQEYLFDFVRKNKTPHRKRKTQAHHKRGEITAIRRRGKDFIRNWEDEYHLNQHLEPHNWVLDSYDGWLEEYYEEDDYWPDDTDMYEYERELNDTYDFDYYPEYDDWD